MFRFGIRLDALGRGLLSRAASAINAITSPLYPGQTFHTEPVPAYDSDADLATTPERAALETSPSWSRTNNQVAPAPAPVSAPILIVEQDTVSGGTTSEPVVYQEAEPAAGQTVVYAAPPVLPLAPGEQREVSMVILDRGEQTAFLAPIIKDADNHLTVEYNPLAGEGNGWGIDYGLNYGSPSHSLALVETINGESIIHPTMYIAQPPVTPAPPPPPAPAPGEPLPEEPESAFPDAPNVGVILNGDEATPFFNQQFGDPIPIPPELLYLPPLVEGEPTPAPAPLPTSGIVVKKKKSGGLFGFIKRVAKAFFSGKKG